MNIKNIMRVAFVAMLLLVCGSTFAQEKTNEVFNFHKMTDIPKGAWTIDQKLDGATIERRRSGITMSFAKGTAKTEPEYTTVENNKGDEVKAVCFYPGSSISVASDTKNIVKVEFQFVAKSKAATGKNYQMSDGSYTAAHPYVWTGKTQNFEIKNLSNKDGIQITRMVVHFEDAE